YWPLAYLFPRFLESWAIPLLNDSAIDLHVSVFNRLLDLVTTVLIAPFVEEVFFRGILFNRMATKWGLRAGIIASSIAFGLMHGDVLGAFVFGVVCCLLYQASRTLIPSIAVHVLFNSFVVIQTSISDVIGVEKREYTTEYFRSVDWIS